MSSRPWGGFEAAGNLDTGAPQSVPTGVRRIYGTASIPKQVNVSVAVLDTGIQGITRT